jgi:signal transduction histidine kinase
VTAPANIGPTPGADAHALAAREAEPAAGLRYLDDLVAVVSHDFRTPLTAIRGLSEMIGEENFSAEEMRELAARITRSSLRLDRMIADLVEFHRLGQGQLALEIGSVDLSTVVEQALAPYRAEAPRHSFLFQPEASRTTLAGDHGRLVRATSALLGHVVEQSRSGGTIAVRTTRAGEVARLEVQASGRGLNAEAVARALDRYSGGFALALARRIARLHGGDLWAEGAPGAPAALCMSLPLSVGVGQR